MTVFTGLRRVVVWNSHQSSQAYYRAEDVGLTPEDTARQYSSMTLQIIPYLGLELCKVFIGVIGAMGITPVILYKLLVVLVYDCHGSRWNNNFGEH